MGGGASKFGGGGGDDDDDAPLLDDEDARCYASRYHDLKGQTANAHYAAVGLAQGRLGTCARELTDYEAQDYLNAWPELQQKFGRGGKTSLEAARTHYQEGGYASAFGEAVNKDLENRAWKCGDAPSAECDCNGTLYLGLAERADDNEKIKTWE